jgi:hypothetical protein
VRLGRTASVAILFAAAYGALLVLAGFVAPVYESTTSSSDGEVTHGAESLVEANGPGAAVVLAVPLVVAVLVGCALRFAADDRALPLAWLLTGLLGVLDVLALASIGLFLVPVTASLVVACVAGRRPPSPSGP